MCLSMILGMMDFECFPLAFFCWGDDSSHILGDVNFLITGLLKWPIPWRPWEGMKVVKFYSQSLGPKHLLTAWKAQGICVTQFLGVKDPKALKMRTLGSSWETCWHPRSVVMMCWCGDVVDLPSLGIGRDTCAALSQDETSKDTCPINLDTWNYVCGLGEAFQQGHLNLANLANNDCIKVGDWKF